MGLRCGIVGLPNVGKSTLFNALTSSQNAQASNYPFCTIEPNFGTVIIPDLELYPYWFEKDDEDLLKTSKRVLYVALSRASRHIHTVSNSDFIPPILN